jgi:hypothetical protein
LFLPLLHQVVPHRMTTTGNHGARAKAGALSFFSTRAHDRVLSWSTCYQTIDNTARQQHHLDAA